MQLGIELNVISNHPSLFMQFCVWLLWHVSQIMNFLHGSLSQRVYFLYIILASQ